MIKGFLGPTSLGNAGFYPSLLEFHHAYLCIKGSGKSCYTNRLALLSETYLTIESFLSGNSWSVEHMMGNIGLVYFLC